MKTPLHVHLDLEPQWMMVDNNDRVNFLSDVVWHGGDSGKHLVRTAIERTFVVVLGSLPQQSHVSILDGLFSKGSTGPRVIIDGTTKVLGHPVMTWDDHFHMVETCSGIGCMSDGINAVGISIKAKNDISEPFCSFQNRQGYHDMIHGDIRDNQTIANIHAKAPHSSWLAAGFSCQPWSRYGDQRKMSDPRASTLHAILRCAFFLRCHSVILECVQAAGADPEVQQLLHSWCKLTGFKQSTVDLSLQHLWPATRDRWWCVLTYGCLPAITLEPFPKFPRLPNVGDLLPHFLQLSNDECQDLRLDLYETNKYIECGGLEKNLASLDLCLPTALHGWGNQLTGCPCHCRSQPLSYARIREKGLHGVLVPIEGHIESILGRIPQLRHIHPWELAICNGVEPNRHWYPHRLALSGLGQLASPLQCLWVLAQWKWHTFEGYDFQYNKFPEQLLWEYMTKLFTIRDELFICSSLTNRQRLFIRDLHAVLGGHAQSKLTVGSLQVHADFGFDPQKIFPHLGEKMDEEETLSLPEVVLTEEIEVGGNDESRHSIPCVVELPSIQDLEAIQASKKGKGGTIPKRTLEPHGEVLDVTSPNMNSPTDGTAEECLPKETKKARTESYPSPHFEFPTSGGVPGFLTRKDPGRSAAELMQPHPDFEAENRTSDENHPTEALGNGEEPTRDFSQGGSRIRDEEPAADVHLDEKGTDTPQAEHYNLSQTKVAEIRDQPDSVVHSPSSHDGLTQEFHQKAIEVSKTIDGRVTVRVYTPGSWVPAFVNMSAQATIGSLSVAEQKLGSTGLPITSLRVDSNLGLPIPSSQTPSSMQSLFVVDIGSRHTPQCPHGENNVFEPAIEYPSTRLSVLYQQGPWVAFDEMKFYFGQIASEGLGVALSPLLVREKTPSDLEIQAIHELLMTLQQNDRLKYFTAILIKNHWVPVVISRTAKGFDFHSGAEGIHILQQAVAGFEPAVVINFTKVTVPSLFPADCGFQTLGSILGLLGPPLNEEAEGVSTSHHTTWFSQQTAESWRVLFEHHLLCTDMGTTVITHSIALGGAGRDDLFHQMSQILKDHGVPDSEADVRANVVIEKIGRSALAKALRATRPWAEIKSLANNVVPKVQLVLPSELQAVVSARLQDPTPFGDKKQKQHRVGKGSKQPLRLYAKDLEITPGLFKQGEDTPISQIKPEDIGPDAQGVVVMNAGDAYSYLKLSGPISKAGLAILVLEHHDPALHGIGELVRFPARCVPTGEPIILTVKLVQVGAVKVARHCPSHQLAVEEVPTSVIRAVVFRDECDIPWQQFLEHPVRHIVDQNPLLQDNGEHSEGDEHLILDVWDRQTLSKKFGKAKGDEADIFIVCIRVAIEDPRPILQLSGKCGTYYEPRTSDGRSPCELYHVVWLNKLGKSDAVTAQQVASIWTSVARHGDRFGLRTTRDLAAQLHEHHKPKSPFLSGQSVNKYLVGPFPFGATRIGILKIFKSWQWNARPNQPRGRSIDGKGVLWECQAPTKPEYEVYHLSHADVLITELPSKKGENKPSNEVLASSRTIAALKQNQPQKGTDPWFHGDDPWANYQSPLKVHRAQHVQTSQPQLAVLEANIEKQIAAQVSQQVEQRLGSEDASMSSVDEQRIRKLEQQLSNVEKNFNDHANQQIKMNQQTNTQLTNLQQQMDKQSQCFQQHLDSRMQDQMSQIERLLTQTLKEGEHKKPRQE